MEQSSVNDSVPLIGSNVLSLITSGMYNNPLSIYREYIQNSADSIANSRWPGDGKITLSINVLERSVTIRDNGPGLSPQQAKQELIPIANSRKQCEGNRGFRGIGRLSGLAFANSVVFLTRSESTCPISRITWDGISLRQGIGSGQSIKETILNCVVVDEFQSENYPDRFFEVQIRGLSRFAAITVLNRVTVREYIGENCPVPFDNEFPFKTNISKLFPNDQKPLTLSIYLNDENLPITRPHAKLVPRSGGKTDGFIQFEKFYIPGLDNSNSAAIGWIAHSSYFGLLPKFSGVRGLRARVGNIQIGNEYIFDHLFSESRFNRWCISEIHILDSRIVPNGRRDYFEPNPHLRNLENHLSVICRKIEQQCRHASKIRNQHKKLTSTLDRFDQTYELAKSGYLRAPVARFLIETQLAEIHDVERKHASSCLDMHDLKRLESIKKKVNDFKAQPGRKSFPGISSSDISVYIDVFQTIVDISPSPQIAKETIEAILHRSNSKTKI